MMFTIPSDWQWLYKTADLYEPRVAKALIKFTDYLRESVTNEEILNAILDPRASDSMIDWANADVRLFEHLSSILADLVVKGGRKALKDVVKKQDPVELIGLFTIHNPKVEQWVKKHGLELAKDLNKNTREALKKVIYEAYNSGIHPKRLIPIISNSIGLTQRQAIAVNNYWKRLVQEGNKNADALAVTYEKRLIKFRAETIARTETIAALQNGKKLAWDEMAERGLFKKEEAKREWIVTPDDRLCDLCRPLDGELTEYDKPFSVGVMNSPLHPRCRCDVTLRFILEEVPDTEQYVEEQRQQWDVKPLAMTLDKLNRLEESVYKVVRDIDQQLDKLALEIKDDPDLENVRLFFNERTPQRLISGSKDEVAYEITSRLVGKWAGTSGDADQLAVAIQRAVVEEFDLRDFTYSHFGETWVDAAEISNRIGGFLRRFVRKQYELTQKFFEDAGIDYIPLYRGIGFREPPSWYMKRQGTIKVAMQPLSSFSLNEETAYSFMRKTRNGVILGALVPRQRIASFWGIGFGTRYEDEIVVLGGEIEVTFSTFGNIKNVIYTLSDEAKRMMEEYI